LKFKKKDIDNIEIKYNDAVMKLRDIDVFEKEWKREMERLKDETVSKDKEINYLQEKINRLNDPVTIKFEKDGLLLSYKKRLSEIEVYAKKLEM
jgi:SMC interacting uncharacterized protein involved in chromosome segregation